MQVFDLIMLLLLIGISISDVKTRRIPDGFNGAILLLGILKMIFTKEGNPTMTEAVAGFFFFGSLLFFVCFLHKGGIGGGDIKLVAAGGFYLGIYEMMDAAFIGFFISGIYGLALMVFFRARKNRFFPLGPFLCFGLAVKILVKMM